MDNTYVGQIRISTSGLQTVTVRAKDIYTARKMLEAMYKTEILNLHQE